MRKLIMGYLPANLVPAAVAIGMVLVYTRLLSPAQFGLYNYGFTAVLVMQASLFYAINLAVMRLYPAALRDKTDSTFLHTAYCGFGAAMLLGLVLAIPVAMLSHDLGSMIWIVAPMLVLRGAVTLNQSVNRATMNVLRYNIIECMQAIVGFVAGVALVVWRAPTADSVLLGMAFGTAVTLLMDVRQFIRPYLAGRFDFPMLRDIMRYSAPLALAYIVGCSLQFADRFVVGSMAGAHALGLYAVSVSLVERPTTLISVAITTATFPLAIKALEHGGPEVGRHQAGRNAAVLAGLILPACVGIALSAGHIADVMVGSEFREGAAALLPIVALGALLRNMAAHVVDHSFHMSRRSDLMLASYGPAAALNLVLDLLLVPMWGMFGAAWASVVSLAFLLALGGVLAHRSFAFWLPAGQILRILAAAAAMAAVLAALRAPPGVAGLALQVVAGAVTYCAVALAVDLAGSRHSAWLWLRRRGFARARAG